jgi:uncharacterized protein (TIGR03085 family)
MDMTEPVDASERRELCDLLTELGPDAPTLCAGWTTLDLAAHLVLREHFRQWTDERMAAEKAKGLPVLIDRLRGGAPLVPWRLPKVRTLLNGVEYFIHHEDVRRANGLEPRTACAHLEPMAWGIIGLVGRRLARQMKPVRPGTAPACGRTSPLRSAWRGRARRRAHGNAAVSGRTPGNGQGQRGRPR